MGGLVSNCDAVYRVAEGRGKGRFNQTLGNRLMGLGLRQEPKGALQEAGAVPGVLEACHSAVRQRLRIARFFDAEGAEQGAEVAEKVPACVGHMFVAMSGWPLPRRSIAKLLKPFER